MEKARQGTFETIPAFDDEENINFL